MPSALTWMSSARRQSGASNEQQEAETKGTGGRGREEGSSQRCSEHCPGAFQEVRILWSGSDSDIWYLKKWNSQYDAPLSVTILDDPSICNRLPESHELHIRGTREGGRSRTWKISIKWTDSLDKVLAPAEDLKS